MLLSSPGTLNVASKGLFQYFGDLFARRLNLSDLVRAARKELGLLSVPIPLTSESRMRHALRRPLVLGNVPAPASFGGHLHLCEWLRHRTRPG